MELSIKELGCPAFLKSFFNSTSLVSRHSFLLMILLNLKQHVQSIPKNVFMGEHFQHSNMLGSQWALREGVGVH